MGEQPTETERRLTVAALDMGVTSTASCTFIDLVTSSEVPKGSAYRACPDGMSSIVELLHRQTLSVLFSQAFLHLGSLRDSNPDAGFSEVVEAGITGVLAGLKDAPWTGEVLWRNRDDATAYLLRRSAGGIYSRLVGFASWCAANRKADAKIAKELSESLVWEVLTLAVSQLSNEPGKSPNWPPKMGPELRRLVLRFASDLGLEGERAPGPFLPHDLFLVDQPGQLAQLGHTVSA